MSTEIDSLDEGDVTQVVYRPFYHSWFINQFGHLRASWRIFAVLIITFVLAAAFGWIVSFASFPDEGDALLTWQELGDRGGFLIAMILAALVTLRWVDRRPMTLLGLGLLDGWKRDFGIGLIIGIGMISVVLGCLWAGGWMSLSLNDITFSLVGALSKALLLFFVAALMEELMIRGYMFQAFIEGSRVWIAVIVLSSLFSVMHFDNPDATIPSSLNIFLAGVLLSVSYLKTRSLWLPTGLHLGWNWMQASFWGMGVSGYHVKWSVFSAEAHGADWISGGQFGAESSIFGTVAILIGIFLIWKTDKLGVEKNLEKQWSAFPKGYGLKPRG
ncbi:MAG: type II CAAX endopeptidase family protein [Woeseiaceae bacterium]|nr:type II CAAX endopeptidase family protein [Woeseiaceae bacterium]MDX2608129.1 type II CAAX endopeptidase family protein [Woeseiaceae bacterium]